MALTVNQIIEFVENWRSKNGFLDDVELKDSQIAKFVQDLQKTDRKNGFFSIKRNYCDSIF